MIYTAIYVIYCNILSTILYNTCHIWYILVTSDILCYNIVLYFILVDDIQKCVDDVCFLKCFLPSDCLFAHFCHNGFCRESCSGSVSTATESIPGKFCQIPCLYVQVNVASYHLRCSNTFRSQIFLIVSIWPWPLTLQHQPALTIG